MSEARTSSFVKVLVMMMENKRVLSRVTTADGEVQLQQVLDDHGDSDLPVYEIIFNGVFLMASYNIRSEKELARNAIDLLDKDGPSLSILIGGLGMGYTLRAALDCERVTRVVVVEIDSHIIDWARTYFAPHNGRALEDRRVRLIHGDVISHVTAADDKYDAILLDVDNGPNRLSRHENRALYELPLMKNIKNMLTRGGVFALWSAHRCNTFHARFDDAFDVTDVVTIPDWDRSGNPTDYFIYRGRSG